MMDRESKDVASTLIDTIGVSVLVKILKDPPSYLGRERNPVLGCPIMIEAARLMRDRRPRRAGGTAVFGVYERGREGKR